MHDFTFWRMLRMIDGDIFTTSLILMILPLLININDISRVAREEKIRFGTFFWTRGHARFAVPDTPRPPLFRPDGRKIIKSPTCSARGLYPRLASAGSAAISRRRRRCCEPALRPIASCPIRSVCQPGRNRARAPGSPLACR